MTLRGHCISHYICLRCKNPGHIYVSQDDESILVCGMCGWTGQYNPRMYIHAIVRMQSRIKTSQEFSDYLGGVYCPCEQCADSAKHHARIGEEI